MNKKNTRNTLIITAFCLGFFIFSTIYLYPQLNVLKNDLIKDFQDLGAPENNPENNGDETKKSTDSSGITQDLSDTENNPVNNGNETKRPIDSSGVTTEPLDSVYESYENWYQSQLSSSEGTQWEDFHKNKRKNLISIYNRDKNNKSSSCLMDVRGMGDKVTITIKKAYYSDDKPHLEGDMSWFTQPVKVAWSDKYKFLLLDVVIENTSNKDVYEVGVNQFGILLINDNLTVYGCDSLYSTYQPGKDTHVYWQSKLPVGESINTTLVFYVPVDIQFENYAYFLEINQGASDYNPKLCSLLPLFITEDE